MYEKDAPNPHFELAYHPEPEASLMLVSDGRVLVLGIDYTLRNDNKIEIVQQAPRKTLQAWYRARE